MKTLTKPNIISVIVFDYATISLREDGIVNTDILISEPLSLEQAKELFNAYLEITNGKKVPHLFTVTKFAMIEKDVMEFIAEVGNKKGKADAFVIHSLSQKILGNFYLKFHKPSIPTKFFSSKEKAIEWLKSF